MLRISQILLSGTVVHESAMVTPSGESVQAGRA